ncbi:MAG: PKD domain-containing protein [Bacteroidota bacterium]
MKTFKISFCIFITSFLLCLFTLTGFGYGSPAPVFSDNAFEECPTASFSVANNGCDHATPVIFINQSTGADSYHWDFGDGHTSCDENPSHVYAAAGPHTVKLKALVNGCYHEFIGTVETVIL